MCGLNFETKCVNCGKRNAEHQTLTLACPVENGFSQEKKFKKRNEGSWPPPCKDCKKGLTCGYVYGKECKTDGYGKFEPVK